MMLQLYTANLTGNISGRVCALPDVNEATVRREINGEYSLTFTMPRGAANEDEIQLGRAVKATVNEDGKEQFFIIKRRARSLSNDMQVYAEHQSYYFNSAIVPANGVANNVSLQTMFETLRAVAIPHIWDFSTWTFSRSTGIRIDFPAIPTPTTLMEALKRLLVESAGGELDFDGFNLNYVEVMGHDNGATYRYGTNLLGMESEDILDGYASGIFPFWGKIGDPNRPYTTLEGSPDHGMGIYWFNHFGVQWPFDVFIPYDLNNYFDSVPSRSQIEAFCYTYEQRYRRSGVPASVRASRVRIEGDVTVDLGDDVHLINGPWGMNAITRILAITFDVLHDRVIDVEFGTINPGFAGAVKNMK